MNSLSLPGSELLAVWIVGALAIVPVTWLLRRVVAGRRVSRAEVAALVDRLHPTDVAHLAGGIALRGELRQARPAPRSVKHGACDPMLQRGAACYCAPHDSNHARARALGLAARLQEEGRGDRRAGRDR